MKHRHPRQAVPVPRAADDTGEAGRVVCNYGAVAEVEDARGALHRCSARSKIGQVVCGDHVRWRPTQENEGVIVALEPRATLLARPDDRGRLRPLAANVTQIIIMGAVGPGLDPELIDRYLVAAELAGVHPIIALNKRDLLDDTTYTTVHDTLAVYRDIGYRVIDISAKYGQGLETLVTLLPGEISVVVGPSGAGKSSLVQALVPAQAIRIGAVSEGTGLGRHTTTAASLYHLPAGGDLIDSPGVRDYGLEHVEPTELARGFQEIWRHSARCRFKDCRHVVEPGCAVQQACDQGHIHPRRLASYRHILLTPPGAG